MATTATTATPPPLYKRGNNGKVLIWYIFAEASQRGGYDIITVYGENGGNLIEKKANIEKGKAGRTIIQQVNQEILSRHKSKKEKENYFENLNENTTIEMRPMLAQTFSFEDYENPSKRGYKMKFPLYVQPKLDGIRCVAHYQPQPQHPIKMYSRKGKEFHNFNEIANELKALLMNNEEVVIDGELYSSAITFEKINGAVRAETITTEEQTDAIKRIQYHIYDIYVPSSPMMGFHERFSLLQTIFGGGINQTTPFATEGAGAGAGAPHCVLVRTQQINGVNEIKGWHRRYIGEGYEGIMLRDWNGQYEVDKRSKYLQKYKEFMEEEFEIVGYTREDDMIIFECKTQHERTFTVRPRGTFEERREMLKKGESYLGKHLTVIFQEYTELGLPRFPVGKVVRDYE